MEKNIQKKDIKPWEGRILRIKNIKKREHEEKKKLRRKDSKKKKTLRREDFEK